MEEETEGESANDVGDAGADDVASGEGGAVPCDGDDYDGKLSGGSVSVSARIRSN